MKIEIEIDSDLVMQKVVDGLVASIQWEMRSHVKTMLGLVFMEEIRAQARREIETIFRDLTLPDGRTFRQYLEDMLLKPNTAVSYPLRPRLTELVDLSVARESDRLFREVVESHIGVFKDKLSRAVLDRVMGA